MNNAIPYLIQGSNIVLIIDNKPVTITKTHVSYDKIKQSIKDLDWDSVNKLINVKNAIEEFSEGAIKIIDNVVYYNDNELHNSLATRMVSMLQEGFTIKPLVNFMNNLMENPSKRAVDELYGFLEMNSLPITEDGYFLAYKKVGSDYYDVYSRTVINAPKSSGIKIDTSVKYGNRKEITISYNGEGNPIVEMNRNMVDDDRDITCSSGLHFCSIDYLKHFGGSKIVILKINPADVVSIPSDYNNAKGRTCKYEIISELENAPEEAFKKVVQNDAFDFEDEYRKVYDDSWDY